MLQEILHFQVEREVLVVSAEMVETVEQVHQLAQEAQEEHQVQVVLVQLEV